MLHLKDIAALRLNAARSPVPRQLAVSDPRSLAHRIDTERSSGRLSVKEGVNMDPELNMLP